MSVWKRKQEYLADWYHRWMEVTADTEWDTEGEREDGQRLSAFKNGVSGGKWVKIIKTRPVSLHFLVRILGYFLILALFYLKWAAFVVAFSRMAVEQNRGERI